MKMWTKTAQGGVRRVLGLCKSKCERQNSCFVSVTAHTFYFTARGIFYVDTLHNIIVRRV